MHVDQVDLYGGEHGVRDLGLLESAIAQPRATFGGEFLLHKDLFEMAAAICFTSWGVIPFSTATNVPRAVAAFGLSDLNGIEIDALKGSLYISPWPWRPARQVNRKSPITFARTLIAAIETVVLKTTPTPLRRSLDKTNRSQT